MLHSVDEVERHFLAATGTFPESPVSVCLRWELILRWLPAMRKRKLYEDLTDIYVEAEKRDGYVVRAAYDLASLQVRYWATLRGNGCCLPHVYLFGVARAEAAQVRLGALTHVSEPAKRKKGEIIPAHRTGTPDKSLLN